MKDTVLEALASATEIAPGTFRLITRGTKRIRVPGKNIGECKQAADDILPCILVETDEGRFLCHEIEFLGLTTMKQSISQPCDVTGAILWLETDASVVCWGKLRP